MIFNYSDLGQKDTAIIHNHPIHYKHLLFKQLRERGLEFCILFVSPEVKGRHEEIDIAGSSYECTVLSTVPFGSGGLRYAIETAAKTWMSLNRLNPRVVVLGGYHMAASWAAWVWAGIHRRRRILWFESNSFDWPRVFWKEWIKKLFVNGCEQAHAYGTSSKEYLQLLGLAPERIGIKRAVVDIAKFSRVHQNRHVTVGSGPERTLIFVGRLAPEKNLPFVFRALQEVVARGVSPAFRLVVVGTGPEEANWRDLVKASNLESCVEFAGYKSQTELAACFSESDILILPSTREPYGLVVLEAMASGLPVLVSDQCGCKADVVTPETGWSFSPDALETLVARLTEISQASNEKLQRMSAAAREIASEYGPDESAERVISLVNRCGQLPRRAATRARLETSERL